MEMGIQRPNRRTKGNNSSKNTPPNGNTSSSGRNTHAINENYSLDEREPQMNGQIKNGGRNMNGYNRGSGADSDGDTVPSRIQSLRSSATNRNTTGSFTSSLPQQSSPAITVQSIIICTVIHVVTCYNIHQQQVIV